MANFGSYDNFVSLFNAIKTKFLHKSDLQELTQSEYNALTTEEKLDETKYYYVSDAETTGAEIDDTTTALNKVWSSSKVNSLIGDVETLLAAL